MTHFRSVPYFRPWLPDALRSGFAADVTGILTSRRLGNYGVYAGDLERVVRHRWYPEHRVFAVASGDVGLIVAVAAMKRVAKLTDGDRVLVPTFTFQSTANAVLWNRLVPVLGDIAGVADYELSRRPAGSSGYPTAVMSLAPFGQAPEPWDSNWSTVLDAAHGIGQTPPEKLAELTVFSLSGTKLATCGEGGLIVVPRDSVYVDIIERLVNYGFREDYDAHFVGINGKMDELRAALAVRSLEVLDEHLKRRGTVLRWYWDNMPEGWRVQRGLFASGLGSSYTFVPKDLIVWRGRGRVPTDLQARLLSRGIETKRYFRPLHFQSAYRNCPTYGTLEFAEQAWLRTICLPFHASMDEEDVKHVCTALEEEVPA